MAPTSNYVLVTAAHNEQVHLRETIRSVLSQTVLPLKWIIVSDNSTDGTDEIVSSYAVTNAFIELHRMSGDHPRNFTAQVHAINRAVSMLEELNYDFIGNIDADITLMPVYFERLLARFDQDPRLGLGGGTIYEPTANSSFMHRRGNSTASVAHGCQFFRRQCFRAIGGAYPPLPHGGPDTFAEIAARMNGWHVRSFPDLKVFHHRRTASVGGVLRGWYRQGKMDYSLGTLPMFEAIKLLRRVVLKPYVVGSITRLAGFVDSYRRREALAVPEDVVLYFRQEQIQRIKQLLTSW